MNKAIKEYWLVGTRLNFSLFKGVVRERTGSWRTAPHTCTYLHINSTTMTLRLLRWLISIVN